MDPRPLDTAPEARATTGDVAFGALPEVERRGPLGAEWWLALGHLRGGSGEFFVSLVTVLSIVGVVLGVAVLNCVLAVMTGFEIDLRDKILGANAHVVVLRYSGGVPDDPSLVDRVEAVDGVAAAAPFVYSEMMLRSRHHATGVILKGVDPERSGRVTAVRDQLRLGIGGELHTPDERDAVFRSLAEPLTAPGPDGEEALPGVIIGDELAQELQVVPGDKVQLVNPLGRGGSMLGMPAPTFRMLRVAGVYHSGMYEYDTKWVYAAVPVVQQFLELGDTVTGLEIKVEDLDATVDVAARIEEELGYPYYARHWRNLNQALFEALETEKIVMGLILGMIIVVAGLLIVSNLYMLVLTKRREIAILKAMGASRVSVMRVFLFVGLVIGLVGASAGTVLGYGGCRFLAWYEWPLETDVYYLSTLPVVIEPVNFVVVAFTALAVCLASTVYPALRAAALDPVEGLRYE